MPLLLAGGACSVAAGFEAAGAGDEVVEVEAAGAEVLAAGAGVAGAVAGAAELSAVVVAFFDLELFLVVEAVEVSLVEAEEAGALV